MLKFELWSFSNHSVTILSANSVTVYDVDNLCDHVCVLANTENKQKSLVVWKMRTKLYRVDNSGANNKLVVLILMNNIKKFVIGNR